MPVCNCVPDRAIGVVEASDSVVAPARLESMMEMTPVLRSTPVFPAPQTPELLPAVWTE